MAKTNSLKEAPYRIVKRYEGPGDIPTSTHEELVSYAGYGDIEWRPNTEFYAELELIGSERGRSSVVFKYRDVKTSIVYPLFVTSAEDILRRAVVKNGRVSGTWRVAKKGQNYGLELIEPLESGAEQAV
jgi:hypothetical protein